MNYPFILKFSEISNLTDARYASGMWADFVGFCFNPSSEHYTEPQKAKEIIAWINGPMIVGEFEHQPVEWINDFVKALDLKAIQIPSDFHPISELNPDLKLIFKVQNLNHLHQLEKADLLLIDDISILFELKLKSDLPIIVSNINTQTNLSDLDGINLIGKKEEIVGIRNQEDWNSILEPYF